VCSSEFPLPITLPFRYFYSPPFHLPPFSPPSTATYNCIYTYIHIYVYIAVLGCPLFSPPLFSDLTRLPPISDVSPITQIVLDGVFIIIKLSVFLFSRAFLCFLRGGAVLGGPHLNPLTQVIHLYIHVHTYIYMCIYTCIYIYIEGVEPYWVGLFRIRHSSASSRQGARWH